MILTPVSALHSRKKGGLKRYEKIGAQRALSDDVSGISGHRDRPINFVTEEKKEVKSSA